jgi:hypothetical protein
MEKDNLHGWPDFCPPPTGFLGSLMAQIDSSQHISTTMGHQVIIRFKNQYGVKIYQNFLHKSLYSVAVLRFFGRHLENYCLVKNSPISEVNWYLKSSEVLSICETVAQWNNKPAQPQGFCLRETKPLGDGLK